jgi:hypothetical protein
MSRRPALLAILVASITSAPVVGQVLAEQDPEKTDEAAQSAETEGLNPPASAESAGLFPAELGPLPIEKIPNFLASLSAQTCDSCHGEIHDQWAKSGHSTASTNPAYLAASRSLGSPLLCDECHRPLLQQRASIRRGPVGSDGSRQPNPLWDPLLALEGVTCVVCHLRGDNIVGPRELRSGQAPHPVERDDRLAGPEACAYCHQLALPGAEEHPFIDTLGEWAASPQGQAGISCQDCHMPLQSGVIAGSRYAAFSSHGMTEGRTNVAAIARALLVDLKIKDANVQRGTPFRATASVANIGAGHAVPTGDPAHRLELRLEVLDSRGKKARGAAPASLWLGREVGSTPPFAAVSDSRLQPGESRSLDYRFVPHRRSAPGEWTILLTVNWWTVSPKRAKALGLADSEARVQIIERRVPIQVN